jgi:hypothetical protein
MADAQDTHPHPYPYGDAYLEWVTSRYYWDLDDPRTIVDTRDLWDKRARYAADEVVAQQLRTREFGARRPRARAQD